MQNNIISIIYYTYISYIIYILYIILLLSIIVVVVVVPIAQKRAKIIETTKNKIRATGKLDKTSSSRHHLWSKHDSTIPKNKTEPMGRDREARWPFDAYARNNRHSIINAAGDENSAVWRFHATRCGERGAADFSSWCERGLCTRTTLVTADHEKWII